MMTLKALNPSFTVLQMQPPAGPELESLSSRFGAVPEDYAELMRDGTYIEIEHAGGAYVRIWSPECCIDMDEGYGISSRIKGAFPLGDDGGGMVLLYMEGTQGFGLYCVGYGDLDAEDATWLAPSLSALLIDAIGIELLY